MERRELLRMIALATGAALVGGEVLFSGCKNQTNETISFSEKTIALLDEIGETILPRTKTPGAKDAGIGKFMQTIITDCYYANDQEIFMSGLNELQQQTQQQFGKDFMECTAGQRTELINKFDTVAKEYNNKKVAYDQERNNKIKGTVQYKNDEMPNHWFTMVKQLTLLGFFTSKQGASEALRYIAVPGEYEGDVPYVKGGRAIYPCY
jgi:Gluconate 2-dehydrogenase subunit 3